MNPGYYTEQDPRFSTIEKIRKLRTAQQIAQLSGEPWDRPLPPPPVLLPYSSFSSNPATGDYLLFRP